MIRKSIKNKIYSWLNYDIFRCEDFLIQEKQDDKEFAIDIIKDEYYFKMKIRQSNIETIEIYLKPGEIYEGGYLKADIQEINSRVKDSIIAWLLRVKEEMLSPIQYRYYNNTIESFMDEINNKLQDIDDTYFTKSEGDSLANRLEQIEKLLTERGDRENDIELLQEIEKMKIEIDFLKSTIDKTTKRKWFKNTLMKMRAWSKDPENQELIKLGMEGVKALSQINVPQIK